MKIITFCIYLATMSWVLLLFFVLAISTSEERSLSVDESKDTEDYKINSDYEEVSFKEEKKDRGNETVYFKHRHHPHYKHRRRRLMTDVEDEDQDTLTKVKLPEVYKNLYEVDKSTLFKDNEPQMKNELRDKKKDSPLIRNKPSKTNVAKPKQIYKDMYEVDSSLLLKEKDIKQPSRRTNVRINRKLTAKAENREIERKRNESPILYVPNIRAQISKHYGKSLSHNSHKVTSSDQVTKTKSGKRKIENFEDEENDNIKVNSRANKKELFKDIVVINGDIAVPKNYRRSGKETIGLEHVLIESAKFDDKEGYDVDDVKVDRKELARIDRHKSKDEGYNIHEVNERRKELAEKERHNKTQ